MIFPVPFLNRGIFVDPAAQAIIDAMTAAGAAPSASYQTQINASVVSMKASGEWDRLYILYHFAAPVETQAVLNWKNPGTNTITKAGSVTHVANQGFTTSGALADGLQTGWNINNTSQDDVAVELYSRTQQAAGARYDWGGSSAVLGRIRIAGDLCNFRLNMSAAVSLPSSVTVTNGLNSWLRGALNTAQFCQNGVQVGADVAVTSQAPPSANFVFGNSLIGTNSASTRQMAFGKVSKALTVAQCLANYTNVILPLMQWNGANV